MRNFVRVLASLLLVGVLGICFASPGLAHARSSHGWHQKSSAHRHYVRHRSYKHRRHRYHSRRHVTDHRRAARVRYGGKRWRGYWRPGPETGYGFRFASYRGDPFGSDDYWDHGRCYYLHHSNYCVANKIFDGSDVFYRPYR